MEIMELNEEIVFLFRDVIGSDLAESIGREFFRGIVAVDDENRPCGSMVWEYKNMEENKSTESEIFLINSDGGVIPPLLNAYDEQISYSEVGKSFFEIPSLPDEVLESLREYGFEIKKTESRDLTVTVADLVPLLAPRRKVPDNLMPLGEVKELQFMQGVSTCLFRGAKGIVEDLEYMDKEWFDATISSCVINDGKVSGMLLVHAFPSGTLMPMLFYATGPDSRMNLMNLIIQSSRSAFAKCPKDTKVIVRRHNEIVTGLARKFFAGKTGEQVLRGEKV